MSQKPEFAEGKDPSFKPLMRSLALEAVFYTPLAIGYFLLLERFAKEHLFRFYKNMTVGYAILGTLLIVATRSHRALGHVDIRLAGLMIIGTIPGVEIGAQLIERLKVLGNIEQVIGLSYVVILTGVGLFTAWESLRGIRMKRTEHLDA